jgi:signal transduction histidine kinase
MSAIQLESEELSMTSENAMIRGLRPSPLGSIVFMVAGLPLRIAIFVLLVVSITVGIGTAIVWVGIGILALTTAALPKLAGLERRWILAALRRDIGVPHLRPREGTLVQRWFAGMTDAVTWRSLAYHLIALPIACVEFTLGVASIVVLPLAIWVLPALAYLHVELASVLLGPNRTTELRAKAEHLQASRARGVDAAEAERRRIERDLHDGAQQRLVAVAMGLGRAKSKMDTDPESARELLDEAHADAKQAIAELRDLARGIYPAVLGDRGLDAALSALAAKSPVPVDVRAEIEPRPPIAVESTAYFIVGEALTNIAKHAQARSVLVRVGRDGHRVVAEITDDGVGGARMEPGGGLAGLADRAATIDGVVTVFSPPGGPTVIRADLPCVW